MIPTFLINLDRDQERLAYIDKQLRSLNIPYERYQAIYGKDINTDAFIDAEKSFRVEGRKLSPGDIGTALSHRGVYEKVILNNLEYALILEDDIILPDNFRGVVEREVERNREKGKEGWEYLAFDYGPVNLSLFPIWFRSYKQLLARNNSFSGKFIIVMYGILKFFYVTPMFIFEILRNLWGKTNPGPVNFYRPMYNAGAYIVTKSGAEKLRNLATPVYCTSDRLHNQARVKAGLRLRWYAPAVVRQVREQFGSTSSEQRAKDYQEGKAYVK